MTDVIPEDFIELTRSEVDGIIADLSAREPLTTEQIALILFEKRSLSDVEHRQALSVMCAILLQQAVYQ